MSHPENRDLELQASHQNPDCSTAPSSSSHGTGEPNLLDLLLVLAKHWKMIVRVPFAVAVITAIITLFMPNIYTARTMIIPSDDDSGGMGSALMAQLGGLAGLAGGTVGAKTTGDLYATMLQSEALKDPLIDRFKLKDHYEAEFRSSVYLTLDSVASISLGKKDGVITIAFSDEDPKFAADLANAYVDELANLTTRLNMTQAGDNRRFLVKRMAEAKADLGRAEDSLKVFQSKYKAISVTEQAKATIEGVAQLRAQLASQEVQLATLRRQLTDNSSEVKNIKASIGNLRAQIDSLESNGNTISSIPSVRSVPQLGQEYLRLMRDVKIQEAVLEMLSKQYEMAKLSETKDTSPFQVLEKAKVPERKSKPKRARIVILSAIVTGFFMVLAAFILEFVEKMPSEDRIRMQQLKGHFPALSRLFSKLQSRISKLTNKGI